MGAHVVIVGRDPQRTKEAAEAIREAAGGKVDAVVADLSFQAQLRRLAGELLATLLFINVLINNAGGYWNTRHTTADGIEHTLALNHLAPFLLTNLLLQRLHMSGSARVITVSSNAQAMGRINFNYLQGRHSYSGATAYNQSKLANPLFTIRLASAPDLTDVSGRFFARRKPRRSSNASYDQATTTQLWNISAEMTGLTKTDWSP